MIYGVIGCLLCFMLGVFWERVLFTKKLHKEDNTKFFSSEFLLGFLVEVVTIIIAALITLGSTGLYAEHAERKNCMKVLDQTISLASTQLRENVKFYNDFRSSEKSRTAVALRNTTPTDYFETVMYDTSVSSHINMNGQFEVIKFLKAADVSQSRLDALIYDPSVDDEEIKLLMQQQNLDLYRALINMRLVKMELEKTMSVEASDQLRSKVKATSKMVELSNIVKEYNLNVPTFKAIDESD